MGKFKLNKKHLFYFPTILVLLFSLNLNTFAATSYSVSLADSDYVCSYGEDDALVDCTSSTEVAVSTLNVDGVPYSSSVFVYPTSSITHKKLLISSAPLGLYTDTMYKFFCIFRLGVNTSYTASCSIQINYYVDGEFKSYTTLHSRDDMKTGTWYYIDKALKTPDYSGNVSCSVLIGFSSSDTSFSAGSGRFTITDLTFTVDDPLINGTPITTPSTEELENTLNEYEEVMGALPQVDENELADLMEFDFDSFSDGMSFVREMFERTMNTFGFNAVLVFALTVGLATYIIGRKVG